MKNVQVSYLQETSRVKSELFTIPCETEIFKHHASNLLHYDPEATHHYCPTRVSFTAGSLNGLCTDFMSNPWRSYVSNQMTCMSRSKASRVTPKPGSLLVKLVWRYYFPEPNGAPCIRSKSFRWMACSQRSITSILGQCSQLSSRIGKARVADRCSRNQHQTQALVVSVVLKRLTELLTFPSQLDDRPLCAPTPTVSIRCI